MRSSSANNCRPESESANHGKSSTVPKGKTLHELWSQHRQEIFGNVPSAPRFPLLIKLLDAQEKLSLQVHPPEKIAAELGGEPKTECWYIAGSEPNAELFAGFKKTISRAEFEEALRSGSAADHVHSIKVKPGDAMFLPAGRFHGIGGGNVLVEVQQNSDTTYRLFDWDRADQETGRPRQLHVDQALDCIDFDDVAPKLIEPTGELLVRAGQQLPHVLRSLSGSEIGRAGAQFAACTVRSRRASVATRSRSARDQSTGKDVKAK